ncbi:AGC family protein kinase [Tritrichomonas foetus]|uniref:AGC family protein kinase n=1 Tax=Tritrichomonas foetus TaxID=1144522 RepID=A0A1J4K8Z8_9EUKA|nr:AGC family protein kinase [Tritrichomonas foetus]|eukprot:OHT06188.1 AGC family protein kinase [Tritrichomonas foetus]
MDQFQNDLLAHGLVLGEQIGVGGFGLIFLVYSEKYLKNFVAKKVINSEKALIEVKTLIGLAHTNIIRCYEYFESGEFLVIILEYCPSGNLQKFIDSSTSKSPSRMIFFNIALQICSAIKFCHDHKVCHRDIKPANILFDQYQRPKLSDFGLSKVYQKERTDNSRGGSLPYMAPELFKGGKFDPFSADIWALGVTLFVLAFHELPWSASERSEMTYQIEAGMICFPLDADQKIAYIIRKMIDVQYDKRLNIDQVIEILEKTKSEASNNDANKKRIPVAISMSAPLGASGLRLITGTSSLQSQEIKKHLPSAQIQQIPLIEDHQGTNYAVKTFVASRRLSIQPKKKITLKTFL